MSSRRLAVAVVQGGPSVEAEVSRASAASVTKALTLAGHAPIRLELNAFLAESIRTGAFDVVFPVVHGAVGEDGSLQGMLEVLEIPYVGSGVLASAVAMSKQLARKVLALEGLPVARGFAVSRGASTAAAATERARREIGARVVVKPSSSGSAIGVYRIDSGEPAESLARAIEAVWELDEHAIVEHFAKGREVTCGVLDVAGGPTAFSPTEIRALKDEFYTYEARYAPGRSAHTCPADFSAETTARIRECAVRAHIALGCRDLSRVDFIVGDEADACSITLLEVNTLPGFTATSLFPEAAAVMGLPMAALCDQLIRHAVARGVPRRATPKALPT